MAGSGRMRGRPPRVSCDDIVAAALAIGLDRISMRAVARYLEVGASTLYYHVESLAQLESLVADRVIERFRVELADPRNLVPDEGQPPWVAALRSGAYALRATFEQQPGLARSAMNHPGWGEIVLRVNEEACGFLIAVGFDADEAWLAARAIADFVEGYIVRGEAHRDAGHSDLDNAKSSLVDCPAMRAARDVLGDDAYERRFEFTLDCLVRGLKERRARR